MRITSCPNSCKRCFVTISSAIPVVKAYNSASAELRLTVCCVRDHAVSVAFLLCTTPPLVLLHVVAWPAVCVHVPELWSCNDFDQALFTWNAFQEVSHDTLQIQLITVDRTSNFSCCLLHAANDVLLVPGTCTTIYPQMFCTFLVFRSPAQRVILSLASSSRSESSPVLLLPYQEQISRLGCTSDSPPPSILVPFAPPLYPRRKFCHPTSPFVQQSQNLTSRPELQTVINMNENMCVRLIVSEATRNRQD